MASPEYFGELVSYLQEHEAELRALHCRDLKACLRTGVETKGRVGDKERAAHYRKYTRFENAWTPSQKAKLRSLERTICETDSDVTVAGDDAFTRFDKILTERFGELVALQKGSFQKLFAVQQRNTDQDFRFCYDFMSRKFDKLSSEQKQLVEEWEAMICNPEDAADSLPLLAATQRMFDKFLGILKERFDELVALQKGSFQKLFAVHQMKTDQDFRFCYDFMSRKHDKLSSEQKQLVEEWEVMICNPEDAADSLRFVAATQRMFDKFLGILKERFDELVALQKGSFQKLFAVHQMNTDQDFRFCFDFMSRKHDKLSSEQKQLVEEWEAMICNPEDAADSLRFAAATQRMFDKFLGILKERFDELVALQKGSFQKLFAVHQMKTDQDFRFCYDFMSRKFDKLSSEQKQLVEEWEAIICNPEDAADSLRFVAATQRMFDKFLGILKERFDELVALQKGSFQKLFAVQQRNTDQDFRFCFDFMSRKHDKLSSEQKQLVEEWEAMICNPEDAADSLPLLAARQRQVEKFLLMLKRRSADLRTLCAESFQQLFPTGNTQDADFRFGYDFRCRVCPKLRAEDLEHVNTGLESVLVTRTTAKEKPSHLPRLHAEEFEMGDDLPRPRLPKSLRQLYGGSVGAESRIMPFFHRVHEVDSFLLGHDFQACDYCKEGWFGTQRSKAELPGKFESATYQKCNFVLAPKKNWLCSEKPVCVHCLAEAKARAKDGLPLEPFRLTAANYADVGDALPETDALTFFEEEILSPIQHIVRIFTLHSTGQTELRGHVGNLFQNGPQYVRQIPAVVGDMKMLLVRRCPKDPNRKQRVPFLASRLRLQRALDRLARPVAEGGSLALQPGALTPEGYVGLVCRENLEQFEATEEGAEPSGLQVHVVDQKSLERLDYNLFTMWLVCNLELQLNVFVRARHMPETEGLDDRTRLQRAWLSFHREVSESVTGVPESKTEPGGEAGTLVSDLVEEDLSCGKDDSVFAFSGDQSCGGAEETGIGYRERFLDMDDVVVYLSSFTLPLNQPVKDVLQDELTAVQELASWEEPLIPGGLWSPEDGAGLQTETQLKDDLWEAIVEATESSESQAATIRRFGAGRVSGLPILDPPVVLSANHLIREDQPYYIAAGFVKLFPLGHGDYWAHVQERRDAGQPLSFWEWLKHVLWRCDGRFQAHPRFYFFALNTALRNKALRARGYFVKRQVGINANVPHTNEELLKMGKANFTKIVSAFEHSLIGSAQEKMHQRSDLEAMVEQLEHATLEGHAAEIGAAVLRIEVSWLDVCLERV